MPFSVPTMDQHVITLLVALHPRTVLDIGPGNGKYGDMVREIGAREGFTSQITAVEIDESYIRDFNLGPKYDEIINDDALVLLKQPRRRFDLVIIGDCIEHLRKSDGIDLLNFLIYRSGFIILIFPSRSVQDDWEGHIAEAHISVWQASDFRDMQACHFEMHTMNIVVVRGYQHSLLEIDALHESGPQIRRLAGDRPGAFYSP